MDSNKSIYQLNNGMWGFRFCTRVNGKNVYRRMSTDKEGRPLKTQKAAIKARAAAIADVQSEAAQPQTPPPAQLMRKTVEEVFVEFCQKGRSDRAYQTVQKQDSLWNNYLKAAFGSRWVDEISTQEVNDYLLMLYYEKDFSYQYVESFLKMFYLIFGQANGRGYLGGERYSKLCQNKLTKIHMPKMKFDEDTEIHIFEKDQLQQLDEYFTGTNQELAYLLGRYCGLRINECFGLTWDCVDFDQGTIDIRVQMQYQEGIIKLVQPKTKNALRKIYLNERLLNFLRERKRQMDEGADTLKWQRLRKQRVIQDSNGQPLSSLELVNSLPDGTMQTNNSMKYHSRNIAEKYGFTFKYHFLRHTYGTQLAMMNTPLHVLCKQMGHGSTKVTEKYYIAVSKLGVDTLKKNLEQLYFDYDLSKQRRYFKKGEYYVVSPWRMLYADDNYYLLAWDAKEEKFKHFRVNKMDSVEQIRTGSITAIREGAEAFAKLDMSAYTKYTFSMFGGEIEYVSMVFQNRMMGTVMDRFGRDVVALKEDERHFRITVPVAVSQQFFGWVG